MLVSHTTPIQQPHADMPIVRDGILLYEQNRDINTRVEWGSKQERLYAKGPALATYDSLSDAIAAAKRKSAFRAPGVVILQNGAQFALHGALMVSDYDTWSSIGFSRYEQTPQISSLEGENLATWDNLEQLAPSFAAVVDGNVVLKPGAHAYGGTRLVPASSVASPSPRHTW